MVDKKLVIDEGAAKWVRYIYDSYIQGKRLTEVVDTLNGKRVFSKRGKKWIKVAPSVGLKNPTCKGKPILKQKYRDNNKKIIV